MIRDSQHGPTKGKPMPHSSSSLPRWRGCASGQELWVSPISTSVRLLTQSPKTFLPLNWSDVGLMNVGP